MTPDRYRHAFALFACLLAVAGTAQGARWNIDSEASSLGFLSLKNVDFAESHRFRTLTGVIAGDGSVSVTIPLDSVDTRVPIRDERMREHLFETESYPEAKVTGQVDLATFEALAEGERTTAEVRFTLDFHGTSTPLLAVVDVIRVAPDVLQVATTDPILLNASNLGVAPGIQKLREIAGLQSISLSVPTWFNLRLQRAP